MRLYGLRVIGAVILGLGLVGLVGAQEASSPLETSVTRSDESADADLALDAIGTGTIVQIETDDGTRFQGRLLTRLPDRVELVVANGTILQIARDSIVAVRSLGNPSDARQLFEDSAANRLVIMPTAFPMEQGEFHVASQEIVAVTGSYGISRAVSVWGGVSIPGALFSLRGSFDPVPGFGFSFGSFVGASWLDLSLGPLVLPYALVSFGDPVDNITIGSGFAMTFSDGFSIPGFVLALGGKRAINATSAIVTENWVIWGDRSRDSITAVPAAIAPSFVFRIAGDRLSWDIGAVVPFIIDGPDPFSLVTPVIPLPVIAVTYRIS
jgi:hypothetical protein